MGMRLQNLSGEKQQVRRRATSKGLSFGPLATAITIGTVAILLGVTFIGDWMRVPQLAVEASPSLISPNGDQSQDTTSLSYTLNEDANVTIQVLNEANRLIRTLTADDFQTRGQHVVVWDGRDNRGQVAADGRYRLQVNAKGTVRTAERSAAVTVDTVPPTLRLVNLDEDTRMREANLTVEGLTDPEAVVQLEDDPNIIPVDAEGKFNIKRQLSEGGNVIQLLATDPAGNIATIAREVTLVTRPPEIAVTSPNNDQWTNENVTTIAGTVPPGTLLKVNGQEAMVTEEGYFEREVILQEGENIVEIEATDDVGNTASQELIVHRKTAPPALSLNVEEGEVFQQSEVQILGKTEVGATVLVGGQSVVVGPLGEFQTTLNLLNGENLLEVVAQDQAGNVTQLQRRLVYDITPPESELARVARNLPSLSIYFVPVMLSLPVLLGLAYFLTRPVALVVSAESNSFRPGLPEEGRFLRLALDLSKPARTTVSIKNKRGHTVATLLHRRYRHTGQHPLYWNGYDDFGRVVPPGDYTIEATASTTGGTVTGTLNISVKEDPTVHRQYLRQEESRSDFVSTNRQRTNR